MAPKWSLGAHHKGQETFQNYNYYMIRSDNGHQIIRELDQMFITNTKTLNLFHQSYMIDLIKCFPQVHKNSACISFPLSIAFLISSIRYVTAGVVDCFLRNPN